MVFHGPDSGDHAGYSLARAGDINGDGLDDLLIGAYGSGTAGGAFVVFGTSDGFQMPTNLGALDGSDGFLLNGVDLFDRTGAATAPAGDVNGDGIDDLAVGAYRADPNGSYSGRAYVVFGRNDGFPPIVELANLDGSNGFTIDGAAADDELGWSVAAVGDMNGDGFDDVAVGAPGVSDVDSNVGGQAYVIFGSAEPFAANFDLDSLDGTNGFVFQGLSGTGWSAGGSGDYDNDGRDDALVGARGRVFLIYGRDGDFPPVLRHDELDGESGTEFAASWSSQFGRSVADAGDVNADGRADLVIGSPYGPSQGRAVVLFGRNDRFPYPYPVGWMKSGEGFDLIGEIGTDRAGKAVAGGGDVNGDGIDDVVVGAYSTDTNGLSSGSAYVVFGSAEEESPQRSLADLDGTNGFKLIGEGFFHRAGYAVAMTGDLNVDGIDDVAVGAYFADFENQSAAGKVYLIHGIGIPDVGVTKTNQTDYVALNEPTTYFIDVSNRGGSSAESVRLMDAIGAGFDPATAAWTCTPIGASICPATAGTGAIDQTFDLPSASGLRYAFTVTVLAQEGGSVTNTAELVLPPGAPDLRPDNDVAIDTDTVGVFSDSFEVL